MLVLINGYPGTGKLTIGENLSEQIDGRLLDVHTVYNLSLALADHKSEEFRSTIRKIWSLADNLMAVLPHQRSSLQRRWQTVLIGPQKRGAGTFDWRKLVDHSTSSTSIVR